MRKTICVGITAFVLIITSLFFTSCECKHEFTETVTAPACTEKGYTTYLCSKCGYTYDDNYTEATGHSFGERKVISAPTCVDGGKNTRTCTVCSYVENEDVPANGHSYVPTVTPAACLIQGYTTNICSACRNTYVDNYLPATGHSYTKTVIEPTCTEKGYTRNVCAACGVEYRDAETAALGHNPVNGHCTRCGLRIPYTANQVYDIAAASTVEITLFDKTGEEYALGSGFFIDSNGTILTNYHVVRGAYNIKAADNSGNSWDVSTIIGYNADLDLAIIKINATGTKPLRLSSESVKVGDAVYAMGSTKGLTGTFTSGTVSTANRVVLNINCIQSTAPISSGNSGGPLLNDIAEVVGINSMILSEAENVSFSVNISELSKVPRNYNKSVQDFYLAVRIYENVTISPSSVVLPVGAARTITVTINTNYTGNYTAYYEFDTDNIAGVDKTSYRKTSANTFTINIWGLARGTCHLYFYTDIESDEYSVPGMTITVY